MRPSGRPYIAGSVFRCSWCLHVEFHTIQQYLNLSRCKITKKVIQIEEMQIKNLEASEIFSWKRREARSGSDHPVAPEWTFCHPRVVILKRGVNTFQRRSLTMAGDDEARGGRGKRRSYGNASIAISRRANQSLFQIFHTKSKVVCFDFKKQICYICTTIQIYTT